MIAVNAQPPALRLYAGMKRAPIAACAAFALSLPACQAIGTTPPPATTVAASTAAAPGHQPARPSAFIEAACAGCHAVEEPFLSPNPAAPTFAAIANSRGLNRDTLATWLADAHNYPEMMDFDLEQADVEAIASYMASLQREDYVPPQ